VHQDGFPDDPTAIYTITLEDSSGITRRLYSDSFSSWPLQWCQAYRVARLRWISGESLTSALPTDELFMEEAVRAAQRALEAGEVPVGAVVVCDGLVVGRGWNRNLADSDPTAHAEIMALREAGKAVGNHRLGDSELFVTIEPCAMCAGALVHARLKRLVYGADDPKAGAVHSVVRVLNHPQLNHQMEVRGGVLAGRCAELLQSFFRARRNEQR
jgi:tRNA(adenine34) deaminase